jgi:hypothetical protein
LNTTSIKQETDGVGSLALPLTEGIHKLLQGCGSLDLEKDLVVIVGDLDVEMFAGGGIALRLLGHARASVLIRSRHFVYVVIGNCG